VLSCHAHEPCEEADFGEADQEEDGCAVQVGGSQTGRSETGRSQEGRSEDDGGHESQCEVRREETLS
jgi:hypothetical protein